MVGTCTKHMLSSSVNIPTCRSQGSLSDASGKRSLNSCIAPSNKMLNHMYSLDDYNIMTWHANLNNVK